MRISLIFIPFLIFATDIESVVKEALKNSYKLKSLQRKINASKKEILLNKLTYLPSLSITGEAKKDIYLYKNILGNKKYNVFIKSYSISLIQPILNMNIIGSIKDAKLREKYTFFQKKAFENDLSYKIVSLYLQGGYYKNRLNLLNKKREILKLMLTLNQNLLSKGLSSKLNQLEYKKQYLITTKNLIDTNSTFLAIKNQLSLYTNKNIEIDSNFKIPKLIYPSKNINPNLNLYKLNTQIAKNNLKLTIYKKLPTINLQASYSDNISKDSNEKRYEKIVSLNINWNFDFAFLAKKDKAQEEIQSASMEYLDYKNSLNIEINSLKDTNKGLIKELKLLNNLITLQKEIIKDIQTKMNYNKTNLFELLQKQKDLIDLQLQKEDIKLQIIKNYVNILYLYGQLNIKKLKEILWQQ